MLKEISKEDILSNCNNDPNAWTFGNVMIKTFSFGDKLKLADFFRKNLGKETNEENIMDSLREGADLATVNIKVFVAGTHWIKNFDNTGLLLKPEASNEDKEKIVYNLSFEAGKYLLERIVSFNKVDEELKKASSSSSETGA